MPIIISVNDMKNKKLKRKLGIVFVTLSTFLIYCLTAFLVLIPAVEPSDKAVSDVEYSAKTENFCLLLASDELSQYCGIIFDFEESRATAVLFSSREQAYSYGLDYKRTVEYDKKAEIDIIGRLGGIVIDKENGYNEYNTFWELSNQSRIFGSRAIELSKEPELRAIIAHSLLTTILSSNLNKKDFEFILSLCETDISYADFHNTKDDILRIGNSIIIVME